VTALKKGKVPVSTRALIQRINRAMRDDERVVKTTRGARALAEFGTYYVLDWNRNFIVDTRVDLGELAKEYGVLRDYESWDKGEDS
jgi:hypothetical protein